MMSELTVFFLKLISLTVQDLDISCNKMTSFPTPLGMCEHLLKVANRSIIFLTPKLNLSNQLVKNLPREIPAFSAGIQNLDLSGVGLVEVVTSWTKFPLLNTLNIRYPSY